MSDQPITRYAQGTDGVSLAFHHSGKGPIDIVWVAGAGFPVELLWEEPGFIHVLRRLQGFSRTIWYDGRGGPTSGGFFQDVNAEGVTDSDVTAVLDAAECEQVVLVGSDFFGPDAIAYAARHPDRLKALILVDTFAHYIREADYPIGFPREALERFLVSLAQQRGTGDSVDSLAPSKVSDLAFRDRAAHYERLGAPPNVAVFGLRRQLHMDVRGMLPTITVPTLVLHRGGNRAIRVEAGRFLGAQIPGAKYVELVGEDTLYFVGDIDALIDEIEEFLTGTHQAIEGEVVTATILFTDIVASTAQSARLGHRKWTSVTADHDAMVRRALQRYQGHEVKTTGDGFLATFDATSRAVRAAREIVTFASSLDLQVRAGIHLGEVEVRPDDVVGLPVSIAKRICDLGGPGEVFVSSTVRDLLVGSDVEFSERGEHELKGVPGTWRLFVVES